MNTSKDCKIAVFDVDGTLISENIGITFIKYLDREGHLSFSRKLLVISVYLMYKAKILDFKYAILLGAWAISGMEQTSCSAHARRCFDEQIKNVLYSRGLEEIRDLKSQGFMIVLATGAHQVIASELGRFLDVDGVVCTQSAIRDGKFTFQVENPLPYLEGKKVLVKKWIEGRCEAPYTIVYTDEKKDLPLLELADLPIAVNADDEIKEFVRKKHGKIVVFD